MIRPLEERFWEKVSKSEDGCWIWTGAVSGLPSFRYGNIGVGSRTDGTRTNLRAHRVSYELAFGRIPDGHDIHHKCKVTICVRPEHLEALTKKEHALRGSSPTAINARKTHCPQGHPLSGDNLRIAQHPDGPARICRACRKEQGRQEMARKKAARNASPYPASVFGKRTEIPA